MLDLNLLAAGSTELANGKLCHSNPWSVPHAPRWLSPDAVQSLDAQWPSRLTNLSANGPIRRKRWSSSSSDSSSSDTSAAVLTPDGGVVVHRLSRLLTSATAAAVTLARPFFLRPSVMMELGPLTSVLLPCSPAVSER